ncbi:DMT family transporter [Acidihalobacter ferrooxydans]|uniref:EamA domain-containing protein n=1 Tax=Acidihalobacter ferrooxydans TaxID=1765967 RepID=A0A1P8UEX1_9GAMM|nr:DMT family transporter [Acidihalobacter ferrooxydans]APZ42328.1 hypothetical protein BW247_03845 [Acidihalobacter ferrooxydans]
MTRHPAFGLFLALFGALAITPDTLLMRWSAMSGLEMTVWRGLLMGAVFIGVWVVMRRRQWRADLRSLRSPAGLTVILCECFGTILFSLAIAAAPVAVVLFSVAAAPVFAALLAFVLLREHTHWSTWLATLAVLTGIGVAVFGRVAPDAAAPATANATSALLGAVLGLAVAFCLALNFTTLRRNPELPISLVIGYGSTLAGLITLAVVGPGATLHGNIPAIALTGLVVLPVSFFALAVASRHTSAVNVNLMMLVETVLGPLWVWLGTGQRPTDAMMLGGVIVVGSLALYLSYAGHRRSAARQRDVSTTAPR